MSRKVFKHPAKYLISLAIVSQLVSHSSANSVINYDGQTSGTSSKDIGHRMCNCTFDCRTLEGQEYHGFTLSGTTDIN